MSKLSQDVEEFIAEKHFINHELMDARDDLRAVMASDFEEWMTGHVRVPVEPSEMEMGIMVGAFIKEMGGNPEHADAWDGVSAEDKREAIRECGRCIKAAIVALNASKGE